MFITLLNVRSLGVPKIGKYLDYNTIIDTTHKFFKTSKQKVYFKNTKKKWKFLDERLDRNTTLRELYLLTEIFLISFGRIAPFLSPDDDSKSINFFSSIGN